MVNDDKRFIGGAQIFSKDCTVVSNQGRTMNGKVTVTTISTAAAVTYTPDQILGGLILRNTNGAGRADVLPTAALLRAALPEMGVNTGFEFTIRNTAGAAETITVTAGTGCTISGTATIAQNNSKRFLVVFTNVTPGSDAYTIYSLGTVVH